MNLKALSDNKQTYYPADFNRVGSVFDTPMLISAVLLFSTGILLISTDYSADFNRVSAENYSIKDNITEIKRMDVYNGQQEQDPVGSWRAGAFVFAYANTIL